MMLAQAFYQAGLLDCVPRDPTAMLHLAEGIILGFILCTLLHTRK